MCRKNVGKKLHENSSRSKEFSNFAVAEALK